MENENYQAASFFLKNVIDYREVAKLISKDKYKLLSSIHQEVHTALKNLEPSTCLSFDLHQDRSFSRTVKLDASLEYASVLVAYMTGDRYKSKYDIDSSVTAIALKATENAIIRFYSGQEVRDKIAQSISQQLQESHLIKEILKKDIEKNQKWLEHEIKILLKEESASSPAGQTIDTISESIVSFLSSATGQKLIAIIGKFMATGVGKILIHKIALVVGKAIASGLFKSAILAAIKKIGIGILIKTVVGKAILALLALVGISGIPLTWVIIPIIVGILAYEYNTFPEKLANKIPDSIVENIQNDFQKMNITITEEIMSHVINQLVDDFTGLEE